MNKKGFTLIEVLVAITVLITSFVVPITIISNGINQTSKTNDSFKAQLIAEDGIEILREIRDSNFLKQNEGNNIDWFDTLCGGTETPTSYENGKEEDFDNIFTRTLKVKCTDDEPYILIFSKVVWEDIEGESQEILIRETLYKWLNYD